MNFDSDENISIKYPEIEHVILNKEIKTMEFINKTVQVSYNLN
jgi:hypothetical protein